MAEQFEYQFEWDPVKAQTNAKEHRVTFEQAATVFLDPNALSRYDEEHGHGEDRWVTLGMDRAARLLVVCHTFQEITKLSARVRIFSARKATRSERREYEKRKL